MIKYRKVVRKIEPIYNKSIAYTRKMNLEHNHTILMIVVIYGALITAAVAVQVFSFYMDDYWEDENYRKYLKRGSKID